MKQYIPILCITLLLLGCARSDPIHAGKGTNAIADILDGDAGSNAAAEMKGTSYTHMFRNGTSTTTPRPLAFEHRCTGLRSHVNSRCMFSR